MDADALLAAWLRALPLALALPLPGLAARIALGLVLGLVGVGGATAAMQAGQLPLELARGLALGFGVAAPVWAARWAGELVGVGLDRSGRTLASLYVVLAWLAFLSVGGAELLGRAYAASYQVWPMGSPLRADLGLGAALRGGGGLVSLATRLALPALLALALVELGVGVVARFERGVRLEAGATSLGRGARPVIVLLLLVASLAAFTQSVAAASLVTIRAARPR